MSGTRKAAGSAALVLVDGAVPLRPEPARLEAMLEGWRRQQGARRLSGPLVEGRVRLVRRFREFTGAWPWQWTPAQVAQWIASGGWAHSTVRSYEGALAVFLGYVCDPRYGHAKTGLCQAFFKIKYRYLMAPASSTATSPSTSCRRTSTTTLLK